MRGRKPQPDELKKFKGTYDPRYGHPNAPKPKPSRPTCPRVLSDAAKAEWKRIVPELEALGLLTQLDRAALAAYCSAWGDWIEAEEELKKTGLIIKDNKGKDIPNPLIKYIKKAQESCHMWLTEFGMTPSSRSRLSISPPAKEDPLEKLLGDVNI